MAAHNQTKNGSGIPADLYEATVIATDTTTVSDLKILPVHANQVIAVSTVSSRSDGTFTTTIEHSPNGTDWYTWKAGSSQSSDGAVQIYVTDNKPIFPYVRASILSASTTSGATVEVKLYFGNQR